MKKLNNQKIEGSSGRPIVLDAFWEDESQNMPIVIFSHGYKGFKDWGAWDLVAQKFADAGFLFIKFNFSHNGGTVENPIDFPDLEAFSENNYSIEKADLDMVVNWVEFTNILPKSRVDESGVFLIGHSRGGGISLLQAASDERVKKVATWASVADFGKRFPDEEALKDWKEEGVYYVKNGRTGQQMPHKYQFFKDFQKNKSALNIKKAVTKLKVPHLAIHGDADESVSRNAAKSLSRWGDNSSMKTIKRAGHTFGSSHPWESEELPKHLEETVEGTIKFFRG
jgi:pimeloyl-ACP methyl ester carboxylesterase